MTRCVKRAKSILGLTSALVAALFCAACPGLPGELGGDGLPTPRNTRPLLVILWDWHNIDAPIRPTREQVERLVFGSHHSVKDYYLAQTADAVEITSAGVLGWYDSDKPFEHYAIHPKPGEPGADEFVSGHSEKWAEAIRKADREFDFSIFDLDENGILTQKELAILIVIPQAKPFGTVRWAHGREVPAPAPLEVDGVKIGLIAEAYSGFQAMTYPGIPLNFGVVIHELGHLIFSMPDMYVRSPYRPGAYSIMDVSYTDAQVDPYNRYRRGWVSAREISQSGRYSLETVEKSHEVLLLRRAGTNE